MISAMSEWRVFYSQRRMRKQRSAEMRVSASGAERRASGAGRGVLRVRARIAFLLSVSLFADPAPLCSCAASRCAPRAE